MYQTEEGSWYQTEAGSRSGMPVCYKARLWDRIRAVPKVHAGRTDHVSLGPEHGLEKDRIWLEVLWACLIPDVAQ